MSRPSSRTAGRAASAKGPSQRQLRAGELIRHALVDILRREDLRDPDLEGVIVTISEVRTSPDMKHATAFVAPLGGKPGGSDGVKTAKALQRCAGFLRGCLGRQIELRFTPELHFEPDVSFDEASRMNALLADPRVRRDVGDRDNDPE